MASSPYWPARHFIAYLELGVRCFAVVGWKYMRAIKHIVLGTYGGYLEGLPLSVLMFVRHSCGRASTIHGYFISTKSRRQK